MKEECPSLEMSCSTFDIPHTKKKCTRGKGDFLLIGRKRFKSVLHWIYQTTVYLALLLSIWQCQIPLAFMYSLQVLSEQRPRKNNRVKKPTGGDVQIRQERQRPGGSVHHLLLWLLYVIFDYIFFLGPYLKTIHSNPHLISSAPSVLWGQHRWTHCNSNFQFLILWN